MGLRSIEFEEKKNLWYSPSTLTFSVRIFGDSANRSELFIARSYETVIFKFKK